MSSKIICTLNGEGQEVEVRQYYNDAKTIKFRADADIDADGANGQFGKVAAYNNTNTGSDYLANGGMALRNGKVVGVKSWFSDIVLLDKKGNPLVNEKGDVPSKTAYRNPESDPRDPASYLDSETIPYIAISPLIRKFSKGVVMGALCKVTYKGKEIYGMVGDIGPRNKAGEVSIEMARRMGINPSPRNGGINAFLVDYEIYPDQHYTHNGYKFQLIPA